MARTEQARAQARARERKTDIAPASLASRRQAQHVATTVHQPVLVDTCVALARPALERPHAIGVDCTLGLAGHSLALLRAIPSFHLLGIDRDGEAIGFARRRLHSYRSRVEIVQSDFDHLDNILNSLGIDTITMALLDLGLSSLQIDEKDRGFAYSADAPLDMRMDESQDLTAAQLVANLDAESLASIFAEFGQERYARRIARAIVEERSRIPLTTTSALAQLIDRVVPKKGRPAGNPAKRVFQALRIAVNGELDALACVLPQIMGHLAVGGRIIVESYHSLEDRLVKSFFVLGTRVADVPHGLPIIPASQKPYLADLTHGAIMADPEEIGRNPRSASVRLRAVELLRPLPAHATPDMRQWLAAHTHDFQDATHVTRHAGHASARYAERRR